MKIIGENPIALQLRYLQTLGEVATEKPSTTFFPVPIDLLTPFMQDLEGHERHHPASRRQSPAGGRLRPRPAGQRRWGSSGCTRTMIFSPNHLRKLNAK